MENIAVVVIGRNEGERLARCLASLTMHDVPVIYVDSASSDNSIEIARAAAIEFIELDSQIALTAARSRNAGFDWMMRSKGPIKYIQFIDGDCELDESWLEAAVNFLDENDEVAAVCGRLREKYPNKNIFTRLSDIGWYIPPGQIEACGGIVTVRSKIFEELGGFNVDLIAGEEPEFYFRMREKEWKINSLDQKMATHDAAIESYGQWFTRSMRTGFAYASAEKWGAWAKQRRSLLFWGGVLPILFLLSLFWMPFVATGIAALYVVQVLRTYLGLNVPYGASDRLLYASFCIIDKFSEFVGYMKYTIAKWRNKDQPLIEYKRN